jgi:hypothetical protein
VHVSERSTRNKSLFASFSSEKEDLFFFKKRTKKLLRLAPHCLKISASGESFARINTLTGRMGR